MCRDLPYATRSNCACPGGNFRKRDRLLSISANEQTSTLLQHVEEVLAVFKMLVSSTLTIYPRALAQLRPVI